MNESSEPVMPEDFAKMSELHNMASNACVLLKAMANEWRLMILCHLSEGEKDSQRTAEHSRLEPVCIVTASRDITARKDCSIQEACPVSELFTDR